MENTNKRLTKVDMFQQAIEMVRGNAVAVTPEQFEEFFSHEIELLRSKSSAPAKPTKTQIENEGYKQAILRTLSASDRPMSIPEIISATPELTGLANQRVSAIITLLKKAKQVVRTEIKKKAFFSVSETETAE